MRDQENAQRSMQKGPRSELSVGPTANVAVLLIFPMQASASLDR